VNKGYFDIGNVKEKVKNEYGQEIFEDQGGAVTKTYVSSAGAKYTVLVSERESSFLQTTYYAYYYKIIEEFILNNRKVNTRAETPKLLKPFINKKELMSWYENYLPVNPKLEEIEFVSLKNKEFICFSVYDVDLLAYKDVRTASTEYKTFNGVSRVKFISKSQMYIEYFIVNFKDSPKESYFLSDKEKEELLINQKLYFKYTRDKNHIILEPTNFEGLSYEFNRDWKTERQLNYLALGGSLYLNKDASSIVYPSALCLFFQSNINSIAFRSIDQDINLQAFI